MSPFGMEFNGTFTLIKKKRGLSRGPTPRSLGSSTALPLRIPVSECQNVKLTSLSRTEAGFSGDPEGPVPSPFFVWYEAFAHRLGPTDSWPSAVRTKACSTSVFRSLTGIFATTTKICTGVRSTLVQTKGFAAAPHALLRMEFDTQSHGVL